MFLSCLGAERYEDYRILRAAILKFKSVPSYHGDGYLDLYKSTNVKLSVYKFSCFYQILHDFFLNRSTNSVDQ